MSIIVQFLLIFGSIYIVDKPSILHLRLEIARLTRVALALTGLVRLFLRQLSFYDLLALTKLCHFLAIPDYLTILLRLPDRNKSAYSRVGHMVKINGSIAVVVLNLFLAAESIQLQELNHTCASLDSLQADPDLQEPYNYTVWKKGLPGYGMMLYYLALDGFFIIVRRLHGEERAEFGKWQYRWFHAEEWIVLLCSIFYSVFGILSLFSTIQWLNSISLESPREWGFSQMITMASVVFTIGSTLFQCLSVSAIPIYVYWYRQCISIDPGSSSNE